MASSACFILLCAGPYGAKPGRPRGIAAAVVVVVADCGCGDELLGQKRSAQCQDSPNTTPLSTLEVVDGSHTMSLNIAVLSGGESSTKNTHAKGFGVQFVCTLLIMGSSLTQLDSYRYLGVGELMSNMCGNMVVDHSQDIASGVVLHDVGVVVGNGINHRHCGTAS